MQLPPDPVRDATELVDMLQHPPLPTTASLVGLSPSFLLVHRTEIGSYSK